WERDAFREVLWEIERWPFDANLIAFATYKALRIGTRTRRRSSFRWTDDQMTRRLLKKCPQLSEQEVRTEIAKWKRGEAEWVELVLNDSGERDSITRGGLNQCCISNIKGFHISRSMATYWRHHPDLERCMRFIYGLVKQREEVRA